MPRRVREHAFDGQKHRVTAFRGEERCPRLCDYPYAKVIFSQYQAPRPLRLPLLRPAAPPPVKKVPTSARSPLSAPYPPERKSLSGLWSPYYWLRFQIDGEEIRGSTGTSDHREAERILDKKVDEAVNGRKTIRGHQLDFRC